MSCSACQCTFESREEQKEHYTLDWHRFNLKRRIKGAVSLSAEDFQEKTRAGDVSSISGSDSESSDDGDLDGPSKPSADSVPIPGQPSRSQRVLFRNKEGQVLSVYRCALGESKDSDVKPEQLLSCVKSMQEQPVLVILMAGGGHFAGAVYKGKEVIKHKTFHRYTVRAKRGTSQSVHDAQNRSHMPKSAGAALRRYNQTALITDINQLLQSWAEHVREAQGIFLRAPRTDRTLFLGRNSPIPRKDPRVHGIPFISRRATFREVQRVHSQLFTLQVYEKGVPMSLVTGTRDKSAKPRRPVHIDTKEETADAPEAPEEEDPVLEDLFTEELTLSTLDLREFELQPQRKRKKKKKMEGRGSESGQDLGRSEVSSEQSEVRNNPHAEESLVEGVLESLPHGEDAMSFVEGDDLCKTRNALFTCCKTGDVDTAKRILQNVLSCTPETPSQTTVQEHSLVNERLSLKDRTLLHVAAAAGHGEVACLLLDAGWDPALRDSAAQTPYSLSADKRTRNHFRQYREDNPEKYNYSKSQIPGPVSEEAEARRADKKRAQKAQKKQREKQEKEERIRKEEEEAEKRRFAALSDREKRALAAERRLAAQLTQNKVLDSNIRRCWQCGESLLGKVPFEYLEFSFCSTRCLQEHRRNRAAKS
ncbi:tRNA endonuclease ANKZF1 [Rhinophrynus dorsalis]